MLANSPERYVRRELFSSMDSLAATNGREKASKQVAESLANLDRHPKTKDKTPNKEKKKKMAFGSVLMDLDLNSTTSVSPPSKKQTSVLNDEKSDVRRVNDSLALCGPKEDSLSSTTVSHGSLSELFSAVSTEGKMTRRATRFQARPRFRVQQAVTGRDQNDRSKIRNMLMRRRDSAEDKEGGILSLLVEKGETKVESAQSSIGSFAELQLQEPCVEEGPPECCGLVDLMERMAVGPSKRMPQRSTRQRASGKIASDAAKGRSGGHGSSSVLCHLDDRKRLLESSSNVHGTSKRPSQKKTPRKESFVVTSDLVVRQNQDSLQVTSGGHEPTLESREKEVRPEKKNQFVHDSLQDLSCLVRTDLISMDERPNSQMVSDKVGEIQTLPDGHQGNDCLLSTVSFNSFLVNGNRDEYSQWGTSGSDLQKKASSNWVSSLVSVPVQSSSDKYKHEPQNHGGFSRDKGNCKDDESFLQRPTGQLVFEKCAELASNSPTHSGYPTETFPDSSDSEREVASDHSIRNNILSERKRATMLASIFRRAKQRSFKVTFGALRRAKNRRQRVLQKSKANTTEVVGRMQTRSQTTSKRKIHLDHAAPVDDSGSDDSSIGTVNIRELKHAAEVTTSPAGRRQSRRTRTKPKWYVPALPSKSPTESPSGNSQLSETSQSSEKASPPETVESSVKKVADQVSLYQNYFTPGVKAASPQCEGKEKLDDTEIKKKALFRPTSRLPLHLAVSLRKDASQGSTSVTNGSTWSSQHISKLKEAQKTTDPTSKTFWDDVASRVDGKSAPECREKWFSLVQTPMLKINKPRRLPDEKPADCPLSTEEDDIFNSTPLRDLSSFGRSSMGSSITFKRKFGGDFLANANFGALSIGSDALDSRSDNPAVPTRTGYKSYLLGMKRDINRNKKNQTKPSKAGAARKNEGTNALSGFVREDEIDMNARLTPGGTLKLKNRSMFDGDDWDEMECEYDGDGL